MRWCDVFSGGGWVQSCMVMVKGLGSGVEGGRVCCLHRFIALCRFKKEKGAGGCFGIFSGAENVRGLVLQRDIVDRGRVFFVCGGVPEGVCFNSISE